MEYRNCSKCGELLPLTEKYFYRETDTRLTRRCRECIKKVQTIYRKKIKERKEKKRGPYIDRGPTEDLGRGIPKEKIYGNQYKLGKSYEVETKHRGEVYKFRGKIIQETDDFVTLQNKKGIRESFLKKDFYLGTKIKELS